MSLAKTCKTCDETPKAKFDPADFESIPRLRTVEELLAIKQSEKDGAKHKVMALKGFYEFDELLQCKFCGAWHYTGYVIETCCSKVFQIGWKCAENEIEGVGDIVRAYERGKERRSKKETLRVRPAEILALMPRMQQFADRADRFEADLKTYAHGLHDEVRERIKMPQARGREVLIPDLNWRDEGRDEPLDRTELLRGLNLFKPSLKPERPREIASEVEQLRADVAKGEPELVQVDELTRRLAAADSAAKSFSRNCEEASTFADPTNLQLVAFAARQSHRQMPDGLRIIARGFAVRLGQKELEIILPPY